MSVMGFFLLLFMNILMSFLGKEYISGEFVVNSIEAMSGVANIFAWLNVFLPMDFLLVLAGSTAVYYGMRFVVSIVKYVIELFK